MVKAGYVMYNLRDQRPLIKCQVYPVGEWIQNMDTDTEHRPLYEAITPGQADVYIARLSPSRHGRPAQLTSDPRLRSRSQTHP